MTQTEKEHNKKLSSIYEERQKKIDDIFSRYSKGLINKQEKDSLLKAVDLDTKEQIIKLEKEYYYNRKTY